MDQAEDDTWMEGARAGGEQTSVRKDAERSQGRIDSFDGMEMSQWGIACSVHAVSLHCTLPTLRRSCRQTVSV